MHVQTAVEMVGTQLAEVLQWASAAAAGGCGQAACRRLAGYARHHCLGGSCGGGVTFVICPRTEGGQPAMHHYRRCAAWGRAFGTICEMLRPYSRLCSRHG
jgi:hypothetical protein